MQKLYDGIEEDPEAVAAPAAASPPNPPSAEQSPPTPVPPVVVRLSGPPAGAAPEAWKLDLGGGVTLEMIRVTAAGSIEGGGEATRVVAAPFWMARTETSNRQFARFDPQHDSRLETGDFLQFSDAERGWSLNQPDQPVCHVSCVEAEKFCAWLSRKSGKKVLLPSRAQWEWACRAGASGRFSFGDDDAAFPAFANLADATFRNVTTLGWNLPSGAIPLWRPAAAPDDGQRVSGPVGARQPNAWGLHDLHGNVSEWVRDPHPDGRRRLAFGGSWADRPARATACSSVAYVPWQPVFNVGFRIVVED